VKKPVCKPSIIKKKGQVGGESHEAFFKQDESNPIRPALIEIEKEGENGT